MTELEQVKQQLEKTKLELNTMRARMHNQWINQNKIKAEAQKEAFIDGAECFGVSRDTALVAWETSDSKLNIEKGGL